MQIQSSQIIFLLDITWDSRIYRFSTRPVRLSSSNGDVAYQGTLSEPDYTESSNIFGVNLEEQAIPFELVFDSINLVKERLLGRTLDNSKGVLSMVTVNIETDAVNETYEDRQILFVGRVSQPVIGDRSQPVGHVTFSLVQGQEVDDFLIRYTSLKIESSNAATVGKNYPFVFGTPGTQIINRDEDGNLQSGYQFVTPAYLLQDFPWTSNAWLIIAGHQVDATTVRVIDSAGTEAVRTVETGYNAERKFYYSYVDLYADGGAGFVLSIGDDAKYFCSWNGGGGLVNPYGDGSLSGGLDIIRYILESGDIDVDWSSFEGYAALLNQYKFAGFLNEPTQAMDFLQSQIIPYLPCEICYGRKGVKLVIPMLFMNSYERPPVIKNIIENASFYFTGAITTQTDLSEIVNEISIAWGYSAKTEQFVGGQITIKSNPETIDEFIFSSNYATLSRNRFGLRQISIDTGYIHDYETVVRVGQDILRRRSLTLLTLTAIADLSYNTLEIGDVILITSEEYFLSEYAAQIISKQYANNSILFTILIEENPIQQHRIST